MNNKIKSLAAIIVGAVMTFSSANLNVFAAGYGSEWEGYQDAQTAKYTDVPSTHWAYNAIERASDKNWFKGYPDGRFNPNGSITRAEAATVFVQFLGLEVSDVTNSSFYDVDAGKWYAPYIEAGKDLFPVHTTIQGKTPFNPEMPVTREDTIYALVNALGCSVGEKFIDQSILNMFKDQSSISGDLKAHFAIALNHELVSGFPDGTIRAQAALTRAEFATLLLRGTEHGFHDTYEAKITSVTVAPESPVQLEIGESVTLTARATYTDGKNLAYTALSPYDSSNNGVITLSGTTITGVKEGTATIKYNDSYLKNDSFVVNVVKPSDAPKIKIIDYPETTELSEVSISGLVEDSNISKVDLTCNGKDVRLESNGDFTTNVSLNIGANEVKFIAKNQYGTTAEKVVTITRTDSPLVRITKYKERTTEKTTPVTGVVEYHALNSIKLTCNGEPVSFAADGTFNLTVNLKVGKNPFHFVATTNSGTMADQAIVIRRFEVDEEEEPKPTTAPTPTERPKREIYTWDWMDTLSYTKYRAVEVVMVIDDSGSLGGDYGYNSNTGNYTGGTDPEHKRLEVARTFVDNANEQAKIGIVKFDSNSEKLTQKLVSCDAAGKEALKNILKITPNGGNGVFNSRGTTYMYTGIKDGFELFESTSPEVMKVMIVLSDGEAHDTLLHAETILAANDKNVNIYTVGLGANNSMYFEEYMKPLATNTGGAFYLANDASNLKSVFEVITVMIDIVTDSDNDGIADYYEDTIKDENNNEMSMNKNKADTDDDGLKDGEEITLDYEYNPDKSKVKVTAYMSSNPTIADTDSDGVGDKDDNYPLDSANQ